MKNTLLRQLFFTLIPSFVVLLIIVFIKLLSDSSMIELTSDVSEVAGIHPLAGILSNLGLLLWCASTSILIFAAFSIYKIESRKVFLFLISSAIISGYLLFDDLFRFHEFLAPNYLGISEGLIYGFIIIISIIYFVSFFRLMYLTKYFPIFLAAILFLGFSIISDTSPLDSLMSQLGDWRHLLEEGTKWLGICCWSSYFIMTSQIYVTDNLVRKISI